MNNTITVIGTVHYEESQFKWGNLYTKLCELKPDVILMEFPIEIEPEIMQWMKNNWEKRLSVESTAVLKYLEQHDIPVRPYDIRGRNDYFMKTKWFEQEKAFEEAYSRYFKSGKVKPEAMAFAKAMQKAWGSVGKHGSHTLEVINNPAFDIRMEANLTIQRASIKAIINLVPEFSQHKTYNLKSEKYHNNREKAMVRNILAYNRQYENKHLVVLCGYFHRSALVRMLKKRQQKDNFNLKS